MNYLNLKHTLPESDEQEELTLVDTMSQALWPLNRSITGPGIESSMALFQEHMDLCIEKVPSGDQVYDWTVPQEWHLNRATLTAPDGTIICDTDVNNLHVVNYSQPIQAEMSLDELQPFLHSIEELPEAIPYVTSYYKERWGFCMSQRQRDNLLPGIYKVNIDSQFIDGGVPFAHSVLAGQSEKEILLSSYLCHPSMANNELSGPLTLLLLYRRIANWKKRRYTYRFLLNPETIGTLCFLSRYQDHLKQQLLSGMILTCMGGPEQQLRYKRSNTQNSVLDNVIEYTNQQDTLLHEPVTSQPFVATHGSDERQYGAPGFRLPMGQISRTVYGTYPGYHNSLDTLEFMTREAIIQSANTIEQLLCVLENCRTPINLMPHGEPQLGKRGLYPSINSRSHTFMSTDRLSDSREQLDRLLIVLNMADGATDLYKIASECRCSVEEIEPILDLLEEHGLISYANSD